ncbi:unnamed protein product [Cunninghamella echinulata]
MSQTLSLYRQILKEIHLQYTKPGNTNLYANSLRAIYKENKFELRERYSSIVLEQKKKIELSAKRVGLQLPKQYDPNSPAPLDGLAHEQAIADRVNKTFSN